MKRYFTKTCLADDSRLDISGWGTPSFQRVARELALLPTYPATYTLPPWTQTELADDIPLLRRWRTLFFQSADHVPSLPTTYSSPPET
jgi:hypothetical protein